MKLYALNYLSAVAVAEADQLPVTPTRHAVALRVGGSPATVGDVGGSTLRSFNHFLKLRANNIHLSQDPGRDRGQCAASLVLFV